MSRPTVLTGILIALLSSLAVSPLALSLTLLLGAPLAGKATVVCLAYAYIVYLLVSSGRRTGRITLALLSGLLLLGGLAWAPRWSSLVYYAVIVLWSVRVCLTSRSLIVVGLHGLSALLGLAASFWAYRHSGSPALAVWCFFLLQAIANAIPSHLPQRAASTAADGATLADDPFVPAYQAAQRALQHWRARGMV